MFLMLTILMQIFEAKASDKSNVHTHFTQLELSHFIYYSLNASFQSTTQPNPTLGGH